MTPADHADLALALRMAAVADDIARSRPADQARRWTKADGTAVSDVDLAVEDALLALLAAERADDQILSEERGSCGGTAPDRRWIIDPIDGTLSFLAGGRDWGTHIALEVGGELRVGILTRPTEELAYWAVRGGGAFAGPIGDAPAKARRLSIPAVTDLASASVSGFVEPGSSGAAALAAVARWVDEPVCAVGALLDGRIAVLLDEGGSEWDQAPVALLVREAGGVFRDPLGGSRVDLRWGLACAAGLEDALFALLIH